MVIPTADVIYPSTVCQIVQMRRGPELTATAALKTEMYPTVVNLNPADFTNLGRRATALIVIYFSLFCPLSLVLPPLDYSNATVIGIPSYLLQQLQSVRNSAAPLGFSSSVYDRITPLLRQLHWLRAPERIQFKLAVLVYKCLHGTAPSYISLMSSSTRLISGPVDAFDLLHHCR